MTNHRWLRGALAAMLLICAPAASMAQQFGGTFPSGSVWGNSGAASAAPNATTLNALFNRVFGSTSGFVIYRGAGNWTAGAPGSAAGVQAWDADLDALGALASTGFAARTASNTWAQRTLTAPAAGFTITNPAGVAGDPTFVLANDLAALEAMAGTGLVARTASETYAQRTITGTANEITVANGDGVAAGPGLSLPSALTLTGKTITGGTYSSPTINTPTVSAPAITGLADVQGAAKFSTQSAPAQITSNQDNYNPSSVICVSTETLLINSDAARNITGLGGGVAGCRLTLVNNGSFTITLKNLTTSSAGNQFSAGGDVALDANKSVWLVYDGTATKWRVYSPPLSGAGSGTVTSVVCGNQTITTSGTCYIDGGLGIQNCSLAASAAANALTIALKDAAGSDPAAGSPCSINFRNATGTTGTISRLDVTAATSLVISSGSTMGVTSSTAFRVWIVAFNDASTFRLGAILASTSTIIYPLNEANLNSSTAEGGAGAADSAGVIYTGSAVTSKAMRILGFLEWSSSGVTAGTWSTANLSLIQLFGPGIKRPGETIQAVYTTNGTQFDTTSASFQTTNLSAAISPSSAANLIRFDVTGNERSASTNAAITQVFRGATGVGPIIGGISGNISPVGIMAIDAPNTTSSTTYAVKLKSDGSNQANFNYTAGNWSGSTSSILLQEIQGAAPTVYDNDNDPRLINAAA